MPKSKLLIVEDSEEIRTQMKWALARDHELFLAENRQQALDVVKREQPAVVTLDLGLPPRPHDVTEGFHTLNEILQQSAETKVIVITGQEDRENALTAIGQGAYDFFCKPIQIDELKVVLRRAFYIYQLEREHRELRQRLDGQPFEGMLGASLQMQDVVEMIRKVATTDVPVLIVGESGVGKELVARAIWQKSARKDGPFVVINCAAIPDTLLESELFGHEKGAFTGGDVQRKGRLELADGGTVFLDEIGELSLSLQVKLLRFLQEHRIERLGGRELIAIDTRVIAATNTDLEKGMREGRFRDDLYYRLRVVTVNVPPLRERKEDILLLAKAMLHRYSAGRKKKITGFSDEAAKAIQAYGWPGNIRELENRVRRGLLMAEGARLTAADLELPVPAAGAEGWTLREVRERVEREHLKKVLARNNGNLSQVAVELDISRPTLYEMLKRMGLDG